MGDSVNIKRVQSLTDTKNSLHRFGSEMEDSLDRIEQAFREAIDTLKNKLLSAKRELEQCIQSVKDAYEALENCESQADEDYTPDCSSEFEELQNAKIEKRRAEEQLRKTQRYCAMVEKQIQEYRSMAARMKKLASYEVPQATAMLHGKIVTIEKYNAVPAPSGQVSVSEIHSSGYSTSVSDVGTVPLIQGMKSHPDTSGQIPASTIHPGEYSPTAAISNNSSTKEEQASTKFSTSDSRWMELGIQDVEIQKLPDIEEITGEKDFGKVSKDAMEAGIKRYSEMKQIIDSGEGNHREYWAKIDKAKGLEYSNGYQRIYESFYGNDPIRIERDGDKHTVINGRHRVWLAKQMGIKTLPASIVERKNG